MSVNIYNQDCLVAMASMKDKEYDLAIVDPPYGIGESGAKNHTRGKLAKPKNYKPFHGNDLKPPDKEYFKELMRVSKNQIIWGSNHFISRIPYDSPCWIVWDKDNSGNFADAELAWTSFKTAVRIFRYRWNGMLQQDMKNKEHRIHPTQKPVALYQWLLKNYAKPGDKILDTHLGSGSSAIAADIMGFDFTGIEIDKDYYEAALDRFNRHKMQQVLNFEG